MNFYIDTHAHIYADEFKKDLADTMARCEQANLKRILMPNIDHTSIDAMLEVEHRWSNHCHAMIGLHPCSVKKDFHRELYVIEDWLGKRDFVAIGETGTDLYWDRTFWNEQQEALAIQIEWAKKYERPLVLHCRESLDQTIEIIEKAQDGRLKGVFHCFTGTADQAKKIINLKFLIGLGGVVTFKNGGLDKVLPEIGLEQAVLETDSPYLAPVPHRGKRNEPGYIPLVATKIGEILNCNVEEVQETTTKNALDLFNLSYESEKSQH